MENNIKISVIVPVYNVEKYIKQCLESIVNQTYKNLEIIVVNDGTKDNSMQIVEEFLSDKRIKVINKENGGVASARNRGIEEATGEYISFVDSDDWLELNTYEKLVKVLVDEEIVIFNYNRVDGRTQKVVKKNYIDMNDILKLLPAYRYLYAELEDMCCIKVYKTKYVKSNDFKFLEILHEDFLWKVETIHNASKIKVVNEAFYNYRINVEESRMSLEKKQDEKNLKYRNKSYQIILDNMREFIKKSKGKISLGEMIYINLEMENWRIKLNGEFCFKDIDVLLKEYLEKTDNNLIEKNFLIKKIKKLLKSREVKKINGLNYFEKLYWKNSLLNFDFLRKRLKLSIKNRGK